MPIHTALDSTSRGTSPLDSLRLQEYNRLVWPRVKSTGAPLDILKCARDATATV